MNVSSLADPPRAAVGHVFRLTCEEKLRRTQSPVISLEWEVIVVALRRFGAVRSQLLPAPDQQQFHA